MRKCLELRHDGQLNSLTIRLGTKSYVTQVHSPMLTNYLKTPSANSELSFLMSKHSHLTYDTTHHGRFLTTLARYVVGCYSSLHCD
jgi:hypothetical protein